MSLVARLSNDYEITVFFYILTKIELCNIYYQCLVFFHILSFINFFALEIKELKFRFSMQE